MSAPRERVRLVPFVLAVVVAVSLFGCGRDSSTTSPVSRHPGRFEIDAGDGHTANEILAVVWSGESLEQVGLDHGLVLMDQLTDGVTGSFQTPPGADLYQLEQELLSDSRIAGACLNYIASDSETRQSSIAFDEGILDAGAFHDQRLLLRLGLNYAHQINRGEGSVVAILDTGANLNHSVLQGHINPASYDFIDNDAFPGEAPDGIDSDGDTQIDEGLGHGTHVAGLVSLVAPEASLMILRVLDNDGRGTAWRIARAIEYAADHGANIINMSLGMTNGPYAVEQAINYARLRGCILVAAAGNWGADHPLEYPASNPYVWAIAASDSQDVAASFTSFFSHVALSAPGTRVRSAYWTGGYAIWSGTSMSAPLVSGAAALLKSIHPTWSAWQVLSRLRNSADPVTPLTPDQVGDLGAGRLDVGSALQPDAPSVSGGDGGEVPWGGGSGKN